MVARTSAALLIALACTAHAQPASGPTDSEILGHAGETAWHVDDVELRTSYLVQNGHGYQSVDGPVGAPGGEHMTIFEPYALVTLHQSDRITHEITVPVDIITAASPDAVDALTSASRVNESVDVDIRSAFRQSEHDTFSSRLAAHYEEPLSSGTIGAGWRRSFADDNATFGATINATFDGFDGRNHAGKYLGKTSRQTVNANLTASQLLSPTTMIDGSYGITVQHGTLGNGWNAVPNVDGQYDDEILPRERVRHALTARISQYVPLTSSTVKLWYRAYLDDFGIHAHSIELDAYQYLVPWLYVRGSYRFHHQTGADFFTTALPAMVDLNALHTADSDLAPFDANEWAVEIAMVRGRTPRALHGWSLGAELLRYWRTNDLQITAASVTIGRVM